ncbi:MAG: 6,7-dimethyl-8-ribityllumazine synthase [bacterium]|nr:6,7-dimethyl-8-ribityllumazine synthase [bacterium]
MTAASFEGKLDAKGLKVGLVVSRFNNFLTDKLVDGALDCLVRHGAELSEQTVARVPGSFEVPPAAARMAESGKFDAVICLGAVIRGDTPHFDYIANEVSKGVAKLGMDHKIPVIFGVITTDTLEQAIERAGTKAGNKGWDAAMAAVEMVNLYRAIG